MAVNIAALVLQSGLLLAASEVMDVPVNEEHVLRDSASIELTGRMETLHTPSRLEFQAYVTGSPDAERALLLLHEWWGLTDPIKAEADYWASRGYRVMAPDLYDGRLARTSREGARLMHEADQHIANSKLGAALAILAGNEVPVFALGWCFGGGQALQAGIAHPDRVTALAIYYGKPELNISRLSRLQSPVLGIWATQDRWITPKRVAAFADAMTRANRDYEFHDFDARHAFANPSGEHYDSALAMEARRITEEFFQKATR